MTGKQAELIKKINEKLDIPCNLPMTIAEASKWISDHIDEYKNSFISVWAIENGYAD